MGCLRSWARWEGWGQEQCILSEVGLPLFDIDEQARPGAGGTLVCR